MKISVILPTYNEAANITDLIMGILKSFETHYSEPEIIVVDDNSPDGTARIVKEKFLYDERVKCFVRTKEKGLATAIKTGIEISTKNYILLMDADGNHDPRYIPVFLALSPYYDAVCGSRFSWGGGMEGSQFRYWGSYYYNLIIRFFLGLKSRDNTSGYLLFKKEMLDGIELTNIFQGYGEFFFTLLYHFKKRGYSFVDIPVNYSLRTGGETKTKFFKYLFKYLWRVVLLKTGAFKMYKNH